MCRGVGKSGSPAPKSTTSMPCDLSLMASAATFIVGDVAILPARAASMSLRPQRFPRELLLAQSILDDLGHQTVHRAAEGYHFLHQARADVGVRLGRHH